MIARIVLAVVLATFALPACYALAVAENREAAPLVASTADGRNINVTVSAFDAGIPDDPSTFRDRQIFPRIREIEARLIPFLLREALVESGHWGAVRVTTTPEIAPELRIDGRIVRSDGDRLDLHILAVDATGRAWLDRTFSAQAPEATTDQSSAPGFDGLYRDVAVALDLEKKRLGDAAIGNVKATSLMRYAAELAPTAFGEFLEQTKDGGWRVLRLPARNDPMFERIERIRNTEFLITDTVDLKYRELNVALDRTYRIWRDYRRKFVAYQAEDLRFGQSARGDAPRGSWNAIKHQYEAYKYHRITAQEQDRLAVAFNNEVGTTVDAMEERVAELEGWVQQGHVEWNRLLEDLYEVESYLLENPPGLGEK